MDNKTAIRNFVHDVIATDVGVDISDVGENDSLIDAGVMDSLAVLKLISFIDEDLGIELPLEDFRLEDFATLGQIFDLVDSHR